MSDSLPDIYAWLNEQKEKRRDVTANVRLMVDQAGYFVVAFFANSLFVQTKVIPPVRLVPGAIDNILDRLSFLMDCEERERARS